MTGVKSQYVNLRRKGGSDRQRNAGNYGHSTQQAGQLGAIEVGKRIRR